VYAEVGLGAEEEVAGPGELFPEDQSEVPSIGV